VNTLLVGGMGSGALAACAALGLDIVYGLTPAPVPQIAADFAAGRIQSRENACADGHGPHLHDHENDHACCHREG
jgi:predicted Fe-Mo cluster-binding NifX family protein